MRPRYLVALVLCTLAAPVLAQPVLAQDAGDADPYDVSAISARIDELGVPTTADLAELERRAHSAYDAGDCASAIPALETYGRNANHLANLIARGLEPFYGAMSDERRGFRGTRELIPFENMANEYKGKRDEAMVMQADCLARTGETAAAVALYYSALDLISIDDVQLWERARNGLYSIIGVGGPGPAPSPGK